MSSGGPESLAPEDDEPPSPALRVNPTAPGVESAPLATAMWPDEPQTPQPEPAREPMTFWPFDQAGDPAAVRPATAARPTRSADEISDAEAMALWQSALPTLSPEELVAGGDQIPPPQADPPALALSPVAAPRPRVRSTLSTDGEPPPVLSGLRGLLMRPRARPPES